MFHAIAYSLIAALIPITVLLWRLYVEEVEKVTAHPNPEPRTEATLCDHRHRQLCTVQRRPGSPVVRWLACRTCGGLELAAPAVIPAETPRLDKAA